MEVYLLLDIPNTLIMLFRCRIELKYNPAASKVKNIIQKRDGQ